MRGMTRTELLAPGKATERDRFKQERARKTRASVIVAGSVAVLALPLWSLFIRFFDPANSAQFALTRLIATVPIAVLLALAFTRFGHRRPAWLGLGMVTIIEVTAALTIVQLDDRYAAYALGMSLGIYASGFLIIWSVRHTIAVVAIACAALVVGWLAFPDAASASAIATVSLYILTAGVIAVCGQLLRDRGAWREFRVRSALEIEQARTRELVQRLDRLSYEDSLTRLANRRAWDRAIERECARVRRHGGTLAVLLCDVDRLKEVNDTFGHAVGDAVLQEIAGKFEHRLRASDLVARIGGDELAVLAVGTDESGAAHLAEELRASVEAEGSNSTSLGYVSVSIGVAEWEGGDDSAEALMARADRRLYAAKSRRNVVCAGEDAVHSLRSSASGSAAAS
jgi:diguanylate cyclase (GGDEF)-like protein